MKSSRIKKKVLVLLGAALVLMTILILVVLSGGGEEDPTPATEPPAAGAPRSQAPASGGAHSAPATKHTTRPAGVEPSLPRVSRPPDAGARSAPAPLARKDPHVTHSAAPAAEPASIAAEKDPARKQELRRMHRLATSEVRVRLLGRRSQMLRQSLAKARKDGTWSAEKIRSEQASLEQIDATVAATKKEIERLRKQLSIRR